MVFKINWLGPGRLKVNQGMFINATIQTFLLHVFRQTLLAATKHKRAEGSVERIGAYRFGAERVSLTKSRGFTLTLGDHAAGVDGDTPRLPGTMEAVVVQA